MNVTEMLERIEKLPSEWRHPDAEPIWHILREQAIDQDEIDLACMAVRDLHLRRISEMLSRRGVLIHRDENGRWGDDIALNVEVWEPTYALALLSAAEAVVKEGGG